MPEHETPTPGEAEHFQAPDEGSSEEIDERSPQEQLNGVDPERAEIREGIKAEFASEFASLDDDALQQRLGEVSKAIEDQQQRFEERARFLNKSREESREIADLYRNVMRLEEIYYLAKRTQFGRKGDKDWVTFSPGG